MKIINNRYEIVKVVSDDYNSIEYIVKDRYNWGMLKVMRIFDADAMNMGFLHFFENSFVDLKNHRHPNITNLYEFAPVRSSDDVHLTSNQYFYTYEYVAEQQVDYLDLEKSQITEVISQLCKVLRFLHFRGVVYKHLNFESIKIYLKPNNDVLVKLSNLADNSIIGYKNSTSFEYTGDFIAPELNWGENVGFTVDIYSFGIIFYYLYYKKDYKTKALNNIASTNSLNLFVARCISQISEDRYQSFDELIGELSRLIWIEIPKDDYRYYDRIQDRTKLVGGEKIIREVMELIGQKMQKMTSVNCIHLVGENGSGKTRTMREIARLCGFRQHNHVMIEVPKVSEPFYCVREVIRSILNSDFNISNLLSKYGEEIGMLLPSFSLNHDGASDVKLDLETDHLRIINRAVKFVREYCSGRYIVILVDGTKYMHLYDEMFFDQLLGIRQNTGALVLFTLPFSQRILDENTREFKLSYFDVDQIGEMVKNLLGINHIPFDLVHAILMETRGKASQIRSLLVAYYNSGVVRFNPETYLWHFSDDESDYSIKNYSEYIKVRDDLLDEISDTDRSYLKKLAVVNRGFGIEGTIKMFGLLPEEGAGVLTSLLERGLVTQNIADMNYVYTIQDRDIKNLLYQSLSQAEVRVYSSLAANVAIEEYRKNGFLDENIVEYFSSAQMYENAAEYAMMIAEKNISANDFGKVIDMLEISEKMYRKLGDEEKANSIVVRLAENLYNLGSLQNMLLIIEGRKFSNVEHEIRSGILLAKAYYDQVRNEEAKVILLDCARRAEEHQRYEDLLRCYVELLACYLIEWEDFKALELMENARQIAKENQLKAYYHYASYICDVIANDTSGVAIPEDYAEAAREFAGQGDYAMLTRLYDFEAERNYYVVGKLDTAFALLEESQKIAEMNNFDRHTLDYHHLRGLFHWHASDCGLAADHLEKAMILARSYHVGNTGILSLSKYVATKFELCEYRQVNIQLSKLEYEIKSFGSHSQTAFDLSMYKIAYLCRMNHVVEAKQLRYDLSTDGITNIHEIFRVKVMDIRIQYLSHILRGRVDLDDDILVSLHELSKELGLFVRGKLFRALVLDIAIDLIMRSDISYISRLLKIDEEVIPFYNSKDLSVARDVVISFLGENAADHLQNIVDSSEDVSDELAWKINYLIGNLHFNERDYIRALKSYLFAFEKIKDLADRVPTIYQRQYVLSDPFKMLLKTQINWIVKYLMDTTRRQSPINPSKIMTIEDYFDLSNYVAMMTDDDLAEIVVGRTLAKSSAELIRHFGVDDRKNLHRVLEYLAKEVFANRGFIFILGEDENYYRDIISLLPEDERKDHSKYLYGLANEKSIVASKLNSKTQFHLLKGNQKGLIHVPIVGLDGERRHSRNDDFMIHRKKIVAHLFLETDSILNRFDPEYLSYIESYSSLIAVFIDSTKLKFSSTVDKLTKVHLRKYFEQEFAMYLAAARASDEELSVIILDIDNFKGVNDTYGHKKGDMVLAAVGDILVRSVRSTDIVARYGGEEFILLLPETRMDSAYLVAEKIRKNVEAAQLLGNDRPLTISLGVSTFPRSGSSEEELIENADKALYYSKGHGKNQTTKWDRSILNQAKRFDRLTGIVTGRVEEDMRHIQAMLNIISYMGDIEDRSKAREEVFRTLLDIVNGTKVEFYVLGDNAEVLDAACFEVGGVIRDQFEIDYVNMKKFSFTNASDYFIDWDNPVIDEESNMTDWESVIVNSFYTSRYNGVLLIKVPISNYEFGFADFNFVASIRKVIERIIF